MARLKSCPFAHLRPVGVFSPRGELDERAWGEWGAFRDSIANKLWTIERINRVTPVNGKWIGNAQHAEAPVDRIGANFPSKIPRAANGLDQKNANG